MTHIKVQRVSRHILRQNNPDNPAPSSILQQLNMFPVTYWDFSRKQRAGILYIHWSLTVFAYHFFEAAYRHKFRVASIIPISEFGWDDERSAAENNTSGFNYRCIADGSGRLSAHATGEAFDVNPLSNPCYWYDSDKKLVKVSPAQALHVVPLHGRFGVAWSPVSLLSTWPQIEWGGHWNNPCDTHHFQIARSCAQYVHMNSKPL